MKTTICLNLHEAPSIKYSGYNGEKYVGLNESEHFEAWLAMCAPNIFVFMCFIRSQTGSRCSFRARMMIRCAGSWYRSAKCALLRFCCLGVAFHPTRYLGMLLGYVLCLDFQVTIRKSGTLLLEFYRPGVVSDHTGCIGVFWLNPTARRRNSKIVLPRHRYQRHYISRQLGQSDEASGYKDTSGALLATCHRWPYKPRQWGHPNEAPVHENSSEAIFSVIQKGTGEEEVYSMQSRCADSTRERVKKCVRECSRCLSSLASSFFTWKFTDCMCATSIVWLRYHAQK